VQKFFQVSSPHGLRRLTDFQKESRIWILHFEMDLRDLCSSKFHQCPRTTSSKVCLLRQKDSFSYLNKKSSLLHNETIQRHFVQNRVWPHILNQRGLRHERKIFVLLNLSRQHSRDWMQLSSTEPLAGHSAAHLEPEGKLGIPARHFATSTKISSIVHTSSTHIVDSISVSCTT
jgi:hypothetical protein